MIEVDKLTKVYPGGKKALDSLSLRIGKGMFGLVGPNGAGKTTLMRILATLLQPTDGRVCVYGHDVSRPEGKARIRSILGYLPQEAGFHLGLTVEQELDYLALLKNIVDGKERRYQIDLALERVGLEHARKERVRTLSGGMKRRLGISIALLGDPRLVIVDEPTASLDPAERVHFRNLLFQLAGDRIVILSTHIIEDVSHICSELAVISDGVLLFCGSPELLVSQARGQVWAVPEQELEQERCTFLISSKSREGRVEHRVFSEAKPTPGSRVVQPDLEDAYLWLVQRGGEARFSSGDGDSIRTRAAR